MSPAAVLETQHRKVETLFAKLGGAGVDATALVTELATHLMAHMVVEEEILYPIVRLLKRDKVLASREEHALLAFGITRLMMTDIRHESFTDKVTAVRELFAYHSAAEERDLFVILASTLGEPTSEALAGKMELRFEALLAMGYQVCRLARGKDESLDERQPPADPSGRHCPSN